jgi:hypothetical protein
MVWRLQGGLDDGMGFEEVDDVTGSKKIFGLKIWQSDSVNESLQGLGFAKVVEWFIYRGTIVATSIGDVNRVVATVIRISIAPI